MPSKSGVHLKAVYTIVEREGTKGNRWVRIGIGFVNNDGSINVRLDAVPINGRLHVRDHQKKEKSEFEQQQEDSGRNAGLEENMYSPAIA